MIDNGQVVWEEPPAPGLGPRNAAGVSRKWVGLLEPLMARPTHWARVDVRGTAKRAAGMAAALRHRRGIVVPPGRWEFTSRKTVDGRGAVYARYLGPEDGAP